LDDPIWDRRRAAAIALGRIGPGAAAAVSRLLALLREERTEPRSEQRQIVFIQALGGIGSSAAAAVPLLIEIAGTGGELGAEAALALGEIGAAAAPAVPALCAAQRSWHAFARDKLPAVLAQIGSPAGVPCLIEALLHTDLSLHCAALAALVHLGTGTIPHLETALGTVPESDAAAGAIARHKIQSAIDLVRGGGPAPPECRSAFAELGLR
jgi:HEAT repeat protein